MDNNSLKCAMDHILDAQQKGEINEDNVLYIVENINVAGNFLACPSLSTIFYLFVRKMCVHCWDGIEKFECFDAVAYRTMALTRLN